MVVVHSSCNTSYLQQKRSTISPPIRGVRNESGLTKSALAAYPAALLSSSHHRSRWTWREGRYSPGSRPIAGCCHRWKRRSRTTQLYHWYWYHIQKQKYFARPLMHAALTSRHGDRKENSYIIGRFSSALVVTAEPIPSFPLPFAVLEYVWMCVMYANFFKIEIVVNVV